MYEHMSVMLKRKEREEGRRVDKKYNNKRGTKEGIGEVNKKE